MSVLYSNLTVAEFNSTLESEIKFDVKELYKNEITKIENIIFHSPENFLKERPRILLYSISKPLGISKIEFFIIVSIGCTILVQ